MDKDKGGRQGRSFECGRGVVGRTGESNEGKMGTTVTKQ